jgi:hypothetical protein
VKKVGRKPLQWGVFILKIILKEPEMHVINDMNHRFDA